MPNTKKEHEPDEKNPFIKQTIIEDKKARNKKAVGGLPCYCFWNGCRTKYGIDITYYKQKHTKQKDKDHY